jgi:hypothetical protein
VGARPDDDWQYWRHGHRRLEELDGEGHRRRDDRKRVRDCEDRMEGEDDAVHIVERGVMVVDVVGVMEVQMMGCAVTVHHQVVMGIVQFVDVRYRRQRKGREAKRQYERRCTRETHRTAMLRDGRDRRN